MCIFRPPNILSTSDFSSFFSAWWDERKHQCTVCFCRFQHFLSLSSFMILRSGLWPNSETLKGNSVKWLQYLYGSFYKSCLISLDNNTARQCYLYQGSKISLSITFFTFSSDHVTIKQTYINRQYIKKPHWDLKVWNKITTSKIMQVI